MIRYVHDLYPRTDPKDGARLVRFTHQQLTHYLHQRNGTGSGKVALRATTPDAAFISPLGLDYVRVVRINTAVVDGATLSGFSEKVVGGYFLEEGDFLALDRRLKKLLTLQGAGTMSVLDRAVMWSHSYMTTPFIGTDPQPGFWPLYLAGTGNELGAILWRVITEALNFENPAVDPDDRTESAIGMVTMTFTHLLDSSGNAWTVSSGDFVAQVGESVLSVVKRLMEAGLYVEMDPDTFELSAWEVANHGRDRTGGAWGTNVLRFERPTDQIADNGNILSDLKRAIRAIVRRSKLLAGSAASDVYATADGTTDVPWEGFYSSDAGEAVALEKVAERQVGARDDAGDTVQVRIKVGNDPANGRYLLGEHVQTDDLATLHTGPDEWEWDEAAYPVAAWSVTSRRSGAPDAWAHLGAIYHSTADRQFQAAGHVGPHTHRPNPELCRPIAPGGAGDFVNGRWDSNDDPGNLSAWGDIEALTNTVLFIILHPGPTVDPSSIGVACSDGRTAVLIPGSEVVNGDWGQIAYYVIDPANDMVVTLTPNSGYHSFVLYQNVDQTDPVGALLTASGTSATAALAAFDGFNSMFSYGGGTQATPNETTGQTEMTGAGSQPYYNVEWGMSYGAAGPAAPSWALSVSKQWTIIGISPRLAGGGTGTGDGHAALIGTSIRAKRCDDTEHYHTTADPTVNDDTSLGFRNNTMWINESTGAMFLLLDNAEGAADWLPVGGAGVDLSGINFLVGTASGDLSAEIAVGTTPGGELGNTWASPTVDATHAGSNHLQPVRKNSTGTVFERRRLNLIEGSNVTLTVADDAGNDEVDITIDATGGGGLSDQGTFTYLDAAEAAAPATPAAGKVRVYAKADGLLYSKDDAGVETVVTGGAASTADHDHTTAGGDGGDLDGARIGDFTEYTEVAAPGTPASGLVRVYAKSDGKLYIKDDAGTETDLAAGGGSGALTLLSHTVLGSAAADITATGLSGSYKDLVIVVRGRSTDAGAGIGLDLRVGAGSIDTGSNYSYQQTYVGWASGNNTSSGATSARIGSIPNSGGTAGSFGVCVIEIVNYADSAKWRGWVGQAFAHDGSGVLRSEVGGFWKNAAAALDQVRVLGSAGNLDTGSALTIYGRG